MILYIDTTANDFIIIGLKDRNKFICRKKFGSPRTQAEKLLPGIASLLKARKLELGDLKAIEVVNWGGSFTSLRIGVVTANVLSYALAIPIRGGKDQAKEFKSGKSSFSLIKPEYSSEPEITHKKARNPVNCGKDV